MIVFLDVLLLLAFLGALAVTVSMRQPSGPEGPVGAWALAVLPCLFVAIVVFAFAARGSMDFVPGGRPVQFVAAVGIVIAFSVSLMGVLGSPSAEVVWLLAAIPYVLLAGCVAVTHQAHLPYPAAAKWVAALVLGGAGVVGWGLGFTGIFLYMKLSVAQMEQQAQKERECEEQRAQEETARYEALTADAPLSVLLPFASSRNERIRLLSRESIAGFPGLDEQLSELLDSGSEDAIRYIAKVYDTPPQELAPAFGRMLERKLVSWDSLQYDEHAGSWELNLKDYFRGAQKIQQAGGDLRPQLRPWYEHLQKCKGLGSLAGFVKTLL